MFRFSPIQRFVAAAALAVGISAASTASAQVVISQVYAGGGNSGAVYNRDFIELFNQSYEPVTLNTYAIQYSAPTTTSGNYGRVNIPANTTIPARSYLLIVRTTFGTNGAALTGDLPLVFTDMAVAGGKLALTSNQTMLVNSGSGAPTVTTAIVDFVGWGTANYREGTANAPAMANATSLKRAGAGCVDNNENSTDFAGPLTNALARDSSTPQNLNCANDLLEPAVSSSIPAGPTFIVGSLDTVSVTFDQPMKTVPAGNLTVNGIAATSVTGTWRGPYVFSGFTVPPDGPVTITLAAAGLEDNQDQAPLADYTITGTLDTVQPGATITTSISEGSTASGPLNFTVVFDVAVSGFTAGDIQLPGGSITNFVTVDPTTYTFTATPNNGNQTLTVPAGAANSVAAPGNPTAQSTFSWTNDIIGPRAQSSTSIPTAVNSPVGNVSVTFNEPLFNFSLSDIALSLDFSTASTAGLAISWNPGDTTVSFDLTAFNQVDGVYGLVVGQTSPSATATDAVGNKVTQPAVFSWILDRTAPDATLTGPASSTIIGTNSSFSFSADFLNGSGLGNTPIATNALEVILPGQTTYSASGSVPSAGTFPVTFATGGRHTFRYAATDTAGNTGFSTPIVLYVNLAENAALTQTVTDANETLVFPMTNDLAVTIALSGATVGGTLTVERIPGTITTPGTGFNDPSKLIAEYLSISASGLGSFTASLTWQYDPASVGPVPVNTVFRSTGGVLSGTFPVTPSGNSVTVSGITAFSDWYIGDADANVSDWSTLAE